MSSTAREVLAFRAGSATLADIDPAGRPLARDRKAGPSKREAKRLRELQERLWAESRAGGERSLLLVLQGIDTSGKDGVTVLKCFLHISYERQRKRLLKRLDRADKRWKFHESDLDERELWPRYQDAYQQMLANTDTGLAPWFVVPSDHKGYRNWAVAR